MNGFIAAAGAGLGESGIGEAADGADIGVNRFRGVRIIIWVLEFGIIEIRDVNFIKAAGRTALGAGFGGGITECGFVIGFIEGRSFRDISAGSEGGKDKIHFLVHITEDFAVDKLIENFLVGGGIGRIFVTVDGVKHKINFLFVCRGSGFKIGVVESGGVRKEDINHILIGFDVIAAAAGIVFFPRIGIGVILIEGESFCFAVEVLLIEFKLTFDHVLRTRAPVRGGVAEVGYVLAGADGETGKAGIKIIMERRGGESDGGVNVGIDGELDVFRFNAGFDIRDKSADRFITGEITVGGDIECGVAIPIRAGIRREEVGVFGDKIKIIAGFGVGAGEGLLSLDGDGEDGHIQASFAGADSRSGLDAALM
nr:MAG TPA: hypothetical protein [Caudoviricetes sp.]